MPHQEPVGPNMIIDVVDSADQPIGVIRRGEALPKRANFRTVHLLLLDANQTHVLLQHIPRHRERHPDCWGSSVASYLFSGETYSQGIARRLRQELGVDPNRLSLVSCGKASMIDEGSLKFVGVFKAVYDGPLAPDPTHIAGVEWIPLAEVDRLVEDGGRRVTPTFAVVWRHFKSSSCWPGTHANGHQA